MNSARAQARRATTHGTEVVHYHRRRPRYRERGAPIAVSLAPMIDMSFLFMIFFLVATRFGQAEGLLGTRLPQQRGEPAVALPISPIVVRVEAPAASLADYAIKVDGVERAPQDFESLYVMLHDMQQTGGFDAETPVFVLAGPDVAWDHVVNAWNAAVRAGYTNVAFGTQ